MINTMTPRIITFLIFITCSWLASGNIWVSAAPQTYESYQSGAMDYCDSSRRSWSRDNSIVSKIDYPEFNTQAVNTTLLRWRTDTRILWNDEKSRIQRDLDPITIGEFSGFKTLEIARIGYRTRMNSLFACVIIWSRIETVSTLQKLIEKKIKSKNSEILEKLKKIGIKLKESSNTLKCNMVENTDQEQKQELMTVLTNTTAHQYCHYRHYLSYLESNIADVSQTQDIEKWIGTGSGTQIATTMSEWSNTSMRYQWAIEKEILRADTTLPKALRTLIEMDQTYGAHILLVLIYDDYIRLRKALATYMNLSSQLYQKANNAQSTNQ